jgi:uncharacterized membrane protein YeaQ/YmgE (transglycosylase-associated protein family)
MEVIGWLLIGFLAGALSGMVVPESSGRGCLPNILVGTLGAIVGGYIFRELHLGDAGGFFGAVLVAFVGAVMVRLLISLAQGSRRR